MPGLTSGTVTFLITDIKGAPSAASDTADARSLTASQKSITSWTWNAAVVMRRAIACSLRCLGNTWDMCKLAARGIQDGRRAST